MITEEQARQSMMDDHPAHGTKKGLYEKDIWHSRVSNLSLINQNVKINSTILRFLKSLQLFRRDSVTFLVT